MSPAEVVPDRKRKKPPSSSKLESRDKKQKPGKRMVNVTVQDTKDIAAAIFVSKKSLNGIVTLLDCLQESTDLDLRTAAADSLSRIFVFMINSDVMKKKSRGTPAEKLSNEWLATKYSDFQNELLGILGDDNVQLDLRTAALHLLMAFLKYEGRFREEPDKKHYFPHFPMERITKTILYLNTGDKNLFLVQLFFSEYVEKFHDVRYSFFLGVKNLIRETSITLDKDATYQEVALFRENLLEILLALKDLPSDFPSATGETYSVMDCEFMVICDPVLEKPPSILQPSALQNHVENVWLDLLTKLDMPADQMKTVLQWMPDSIIPYFKHPQMLMDFLTDCYNMGGAIPILALNGLWQLMKRFNLDYPNFYVKLYALFDKNLMHWRYRSRFFRLADIFLGSTHLPAALVASFIKRMARLCLSAPPAGIATVIPLIYNLLKRHPQCTFMIHQEHYDRDKVRESGMKDPFDDEEPDPTKTGALQSSLWEIETLRTHYNVNIKTLARVISEQFTKNEYKIEDFLDHGYGSMVEADLQKELRKEVVVEWDIPKRCFGKEAKGQEGQPGSEAAGSTLTEIWEFWES